MSPSGKEDEEGEAIFTFSDSAHHPTINLRKVVKSRRVGTGADLQIQRLFFYQPPVVMHPRVSPSRFASPLIRRCPGPGVHCAPPRFILQTPHPKLIVKISYPGGDDWCSFPWPSSVSFLFEVVVSMSVVQVCRLEFCLAPMGGIAVDVVDLKEVRTATCDPALPRDCPPYLMRLLNREYTRPLVSSSRRRSFAPFTNISVQLVVALAESDVEWVLGIPTVDR
jgi:hypothetical protein